MPIFKPVKHSDRHYHERLESEISQKILKLDTPEFSITENDALNERRSQIVANIGAHVVKGNPSTSKTKGSSISKRKCSKLGPSEKTSDTSIEKCPRTVAYTGVEGATRDSGGPSISKVKGSIISKECSELDTSGKMSECETTGQDMDTIITDDIPRDSDEACMSGNENCSSSLDSEWGIDEQEINNLLEEALPEEYKRTPARINRKSRKQEEDIVVKEKILLEDFGGNNFEVLPAGWIQVTHNSGLTVYLNRTLRVVTLSKPYFLGSGNRETHNIPVSSIPCLAYKKALEAQADLNEENCYKEICGLLIPITKLESASMNEKMNSLEPEEFRMYCEKVFTFKKEEKRKPHQASKSTVEESKNRPGLPPGTTLISFPVIDKDDEGQILRRRQVVLNPSGKSYVAVLHEFLQQGLKVQPSYEFKDTADPKNPFSSTIHLQGKELGSAVATSKKLAKLEAAKVTLEMLIPELKGKSESVCKLRNGDHDDMSNEYENSSNIFDEVTITDSRVSELCAKSTEPPPYTILLTCLKRTFGMCNVVTDYHVNRKHNKQNQYTMKVGKHTVTVMCKNKREGKQRAAQTILQALHPQIKTWGSLIRLYGTKSVKNAKEKKQEEQEITGLQGKSELNTPNFAVLNKLKEELIKIAESRKEVVRTETVTIPNAPSLSGVNLNSLNYE